MAKVWNILALLLVITALVWSTTLWRWQSSQYDPSPFDLALNLGLLPMVLSAGLVAAVWGVTRLRDHAAIPTPVPVAVSSVAPAASNVALPERSAHFRVLGRAVKVRRGSNWREAHTAISEGACKPELDEALKEDDGIAAFTPPCADLDTSGAAGELLALTQALSAVQPQAWASHETPVDLSRRLSLLRDAIEAMQEPLAAQWAALGAPPPHLDPVQDSLRLGVGCGDLGVARLPACTALAIGQVKEIHAPAMLLGAFPAFERLAVVVTPPVAPPAPTPAAAQADATQAA